jgi:hypothetical protein
MIAIYSNNYITDYYVSLLNFFSQPYQIYHSVEQYTTAPAAVKIALVNHINSYELPASEQQRLEQVIEGRKFSQEIAQAKNYSDLVFAFDAELHLYSIEIIQQHRQSNVVWVIPGKINDPTIVDQSQVIVRNEHFKLTTDSYVNIPHLLTQIQHNIVKPMYFDALLGTVKPHRDFLHNSILNYNLQHKILSTYQNQGPGKLQEIGLWESDIEQFDHVVTRFTDQVQYHGQHLALARILPIDVYNRTAYSIVAETGTDNRYSFFTEKTAKPIIARRLFVMFSGRGFLKNLHNLGYQTFGNVIDESYDLIYNDYERWSAAFEQVQLLCSMDQQTVLEKIAPAVEHNYKYLMTVDWVKLTIHHLQQKINSLIAPI